MMTARGRHNQDWDPMRDDFDNSSYDPQHPDDNSGGYVNLDHCRLYIRNIPMGLNDEGLSSAFSRYGTLTEAYVHKDPEKRYGLVAFETPGEAKLAMMKLNRAEPLKLNITIAHKSKAKNPSNWKDNSGYRGGNSSGTRDRDDRSFRDDTGSARSQSNSRRQDLMANGDNMEDLVDDGPIVSGSLEPELNLELEQLKLEHLKLQEAQVLCKHRMLLLKQAEKKSSSSSRCILPDGRIVVRNVERGETHDGDASFGAGAGDSSCGVCVVCLERATAFCAGCRVTPYCSAACQRRDWAERHKKVCHNLRRQSGGVAASKPEPELESVIPAAAPLRRPRSPEPAPRDDSSDRAPPRKFGPPGNAMASVPTTGNQGGPRNAGPRGYQNRANQSFDSSRNQNDNRNQSDNRARFNRSGDGDVDRSTGNDRNYRDRKQSDRNQNDRNESFGRKPQERLDRNRNQDGDNNRNNSRQSSGGHNDRRPQTTTERDEDWGPKPVQKIQEQKPAFEPKTPQMQKEEPKVEAPTPVPQAAVSAKPLASAADVLPVSRKLVPKNCVIDLLAVGVTFIANVDAKDEDADSGWLCTACHPDYAETYQLLFEPLAEMCEASEVYEPRPGETFGYLDEEDGCWYRARCLAPARAALLDAGRYVRATPANCRRLPAAAADIPEFCCRLASAALQLDNKVDCTIVSKCNGTLTVSLVNQETGATLGTGSASRWLPAVELPSEPAPAPAPARSAAHTPAASETVAAPSKPAAAEIPQVPRPPVSNNSAVLLVEATEPSRVFVRPSQRDRQAEFDDLLCEVALYGADDTNPRLSELPIAGQTVVARFTDGNYFRALVQRVSSKKKRCLLEYVEYGNVAAVQLEDICPCPAEFDLASRPTLTSLVTLQMKQNTFTEPATAYLDQLKEDGAELTLTIPSGEKTAPSKTPVRLVVADSGEDVNRRVDDLSTPEWKKLLESGGDVLQTKKIMYSELKFVDLPAAGGELEVVEASTLEGGLVTGHERGAAHVLRAHRLADQLQEYCNSELAKDPYLPSTEELCIALCPERNQWLRAVLLEQEGGPGGRSAQVLFYDHGHLAVVPVAHLRKMVADFVHAAPPAVCTITIKDFPKAPTAEQLERARRHMQLNARGAGTLRFASAVKQDIGDYVVCAPDLLRAMQ